MNTYLHEVLSYSTQNVFRRVICKIGDKNAFTQILDCIFKFWWIIQPITFNDEKTNSPFI